MEELAQLGMRLSAALQGVGGESDRLLLLRTSVYALAFLAALLIPPGLVYFASRRRDFEFKGILWVLGLAFVVATISHALDLWGLLEPDRWLLGTAQVVTATFALGIAVAFWMYIPDAVRVKNRQRHARAELAKETSERQRAQERAREEALLLRNLIEQASVGMALVSAAGAWLQVNEALAGIFNLSRAELKKQEPRALLGARLLAADHGAVVEERDHQTANGLRRYRWHAAPIRDGAGNLRARLIEGQEIPAASNAPAIARMRQEFEAQMGERTREAGEAEARLEQALAEKQKSETELAARAATLERQAAQLEQLGRRLNELAGQDTHTGLLSSHAFAERLDFALAFAKRFGQGFTVVVLAADAVDDTGGARDVVLAALGGVLRTELRETDAAARCDEERFCVLLAGCDATAGALIAERIRRRLASTPIAAPDGRSLRLTCSAGIASWSAGRGLSDLLGEAGDGLRAARAGGRNRVAPRRATRDD